MYRKGEKKLKKVRMVLIVLVLLGCISVAVYLNSVGRKEVPIRGRQTASRI